MDEDTRELMRGAAVLLDHYFNPGLSGEERTIGFILVAFPFGTGNRDANFISNGGDHVENIDVLKTLVKRLTT